MKRFMIEVADDYVPEDGDTFDGVVSALEHFDIPCCVVELHPTAPDGLTSYIVSYTDYDEPLGVMQMQFWAEDADHAAEQMQDAVPFSKISKVETQVDYEQRTGTELDYGR